MSLIAPAMWVMFFDLFPGAGLLLAAKSYFEGFGTSVPSQEDMFQICSEALAKYQDFNKYRLFARKLFGDWIHVDDPPCSFSDSSELEPSARFSFVEKLFDYIGNREAQERFYEELRTRTTPGPLGCFFWQGLLICCTILLIVRLLLRSRRTHQNSWETEKNRHPNSS